MSGFVSLVGAGPGDPELITVRGLRRLREAEVVLYDSLVDPSLVDGLDAELVFVGKRCGVQAMSQDEIQRTLIAYATAGRRVVRLKGGDPFVFGRGGEEALALRQAGVAFEVVPGVTSAVAAPAFAGVPVTHRGVADGFTVVTAHRRTDHRDFAIPPYSPRRTVVLLMSVRTMPVWSAQMLESGYPADEPVALVMWGTTDKQKSVRTTLASVVEDAAASAIDSPCVAVVGKVADLAEAIGPLAVPEEQGGGDPGGWNG